MNTIKTYSELIRMNTFDERLSYLTIAGSVGVETFGFDRIFNQKFYTSTEWKRIRNYVINRDNACDLGLDGYEIMYEPIYIHHLNPITIDDIRDATEYLLNPEYLICTRFKTHQQIHYGKKNNEQSLLTIERKPFDTCPWKK